MKKIKSTEGIFVRRQNSASQQKRQGSSANAQNLLVGSDKMNDKNKKIGDIPTRLGNNRDEMPLTDKNPNQKKTLDIDMTLDDEKGSKSKKKKGRKGWRPSRKFIKRLVIAIIILLLLVAGFFVYKLFIASNNVFRGGGESVLADDGIDKSKLQHEGDGRVNILLAATSEDDPDHPGGILTDSIMFLSVDPVNKGATMVSIPRDLWVNMPGCTLYSREKINAAYQCGEEMAFKEDGLSEGGMGLLEKIIKEVTGLNINYYAKINYTAFREAVDAVGGIDILIDSPDPRGIMDRNFDWICNYQCYKVKHPNGMVHLDGEHALYLARSRNSAGGYGMPRGDFDRTEYQRKMLIALKEKATSLETLSNPVKLSALIDSIGNNLVTSFSRDDMLNLYSVAKDMSADSIKSIGLADEENPLLTTGMAGGASIVQPLAGLFEYGDVQIFLRGQMIDPYIVNEDPKIAIFNGTGIAGLASEQKEVLESYGYKVVLVGDSPTESYAETAFYDNTNGEKEITLQYLQNRYGVQSKNGELPEGIDASYDTGEVDEEGNPKPAKTADYVIILGQDVAN